MQINNVLPTVIVVDDFYTEPDKVRKLALEQTFFEHIEYHKGKRTHEAFRFEGIKERFEHLLNRKIKNWENSCVNGCFQVCVSTDAIVYHCDLQRYAAVIFLTPDAPIHGGTNILRSIHTKDRKTSPETGSIVFRHGFFDSTEFDILDKIGNQYNRLVMWDAQCLHAASAYFGNNLENGRLFQIFFFDIEENV
jgi:hypothetical protein